jgi:polyisoprenoid-binding protein YceI
MRIISLRSRARIGFAGLAILFVAASTNGQPTTAPQSVQAGAYVLDKSHAKLNWAVSHFGFSTYTGEFTSFDANLQLDPARPERSLLTVTIDTASVETNDDKLDEHLRSAEFFNSAKHPKATFRSTQVKPTGPRTARVTGDLTLNGVTKPVALDVVFNGAGMNAATKNYVAGFSAETKISRSQFGVATYSPAIGEEVTLTISGEFNPRPTSSAR